MRNTFGSIGDILPFFLLVVFAAGLAGGGCADDPSTAGVHLLPPSDLPVFFVDTLYPVSFSSAYATISTASSDPGVPTWSPRALFVGQRQTLKAGTFIRFFEFPDSLQGIEVIAAEVVLSFHSVYGDSLGLSAGPYNIHRAGGSWTGDSLTYDSLITFPGMYYDPVPRPDGVPTGTIDTGRITLALDTALVREWFSVTIDTSTNNQGMFITANPSNTIQGFWSFANPSAALFPKLRVRYSRNGVTTTYEHSTGFSRYLATVPPGDLLQDPSRLYVQTGVAYRGTLTFDLSSLPAPVSVNRAVIELSLDSVASDRSIYSSDSLFAFAVTGTGALGASTLGLGIPLPEPTRRVYSFNGESIVRTWLQSAVEQTAVIAGFSENSTLTRFVFFGPAAADDLRPRLIVTYSRVQKSGREGGGQ